MIGVVVLNVLDSGNKLALLFYSFTINYIIPHDSIGLGRVKMVVHHYFQAKRVIYIHFIKNWFSNYVNKKCNFIQNILPNAILRGCNYSRETCKVRFSNNPISMFAKVEFIYFSLYTPRLFAQNVFFKLKECDAIFVKLYFIR